MLADAEDGLPYDEPPLSKVFLGLDAVQAPLISDQELAGLEVDFRPGVRALSLDPDRRTVTFDRGCRHRCPRCDQPCGPRPV